MDKIMAYYGVKHYKYNAITKTVYIYDIMLVETFVKLRKKLHHNFKINNIIVRGR